MNDKTIIHLNKMSLDRALELASQLPNNIAGFLINDLIYHYGCEAIYELKKFNSVIADLKLVTPATDISNTLRIMISGGANFVTIYSPTFKPKNKFLPYCIQYAPSKIEQVVKTKYPYVFCSPKDLARIKELPIKKICNYLPEYDLKIADLIVVHWSVFLNDKFPFKTPNV